MKACPICAGKMYRHQGHVLGSGEQKQRFRCGTCKFIESFYRRTAADTWTPEKRKQGRTRIDDSKIFVSNIATWLTPVRVGA